MQQWRWGVIFILAREVNLSKDNHSIFFLTKQKITILVSVFCLTILLAFMLKPIAGVPFISSELFQLGDAILSSYKLSV